MKIKLFQLRLICWSDRCLILDYQQTELDHLRRKSKVREKTEKRKKPGKKVQEKNSLSLFSSLFLFLVLTQIVISGTTASSGVLTAPTK